MPYTLQELRVYGTVYFRFCKVLTGYTSRGPDRIHLLPQVSHLQRRPLRLIQEYSEYSKFPGFFPPGPWQDSSRTSRCRIPDLLPEGEDFQWLRHSPAASKVHIYLPGDPAVHRQRWQRRRWKAYWCMGELPEVLRLCLDL